MSDNERTLLLQRAQVQFGAPSSGDLKLSNSSSRGIYCCLLDSTGNCTHMYTPTQTHTYILIKNKIPFIFMETVNLVIAKGEEIYTVQRERCMYSSMHVYVQGDSEVARPIEEGHVCTAQSDTGTRLQVYYYRREWEFA